MIRHAQKTEATKLAQIVSQSRDYYEIQKETPLITPSYIFNNTVFVYEKCTEAHSQGILGFYAITARRASSIYNGNINTPEFWLDYLSLKPGNHGKGIGTALFDHLRDECRSRQIKRICILSDPAAKNFYLKMSCRYVREYPLINVNRTAPLLTMDIDSS